MTLKTLLKSHAHLSRLLSDCRYGTPRHEELLVQLEAIEQQIGLLKAERSPKPQLCSTMELAA